MMRAYRGIGLRSRFLYVFVYVMRAINQELQSYTAQFDNAQHEMTFCHKSTSNYFLC